HHTTTTHRTVTHSRNVTSRHAQSLTARRQTSVTRRPTTTASNRGNQGMTRQPTATAARNNQGATRRPTAQNTNARRPATPTPTARTTSSTERSIQAKKQQSEQHRPTVQLRVTMTSKCGTCHGCKQNQSTITNVPPRVPFVTTTRQPAQPTVA